MPQASDFAAGALKRITDTWDARAGRPYELEARLHVLTPAGAVPVPASVYVRLQGRLKTFVAKYPSTPVLNTLVTDGIDAAGIRQSVDSYGTTTYIRKQRVYTEDAPQIGVRLALALEEPVAPPRVFTAVTTRLKTRTSYVLMGGAVRLDMTKVETTTNGKQSRTTYEVEVEALGAFDKFLRAVDFVWKELHATETLYTLRDLQELGKDIAKVIGTQRPNDDFRDFNKLVLVQARNLKREDLVYGGLVGNPDTHYAFTFKTDGQRKVMMFSTTGVWLAMPPYEYDRVLGPDPAWTGLSGTWLDGEMIPASMRTQRNGAASPPSTKYWFLAFDYIMHLGDLSVQEKTLSDRLYLAQKVVRFFENNSVITVNAKEFYNIHTVEDAFSTMVALRAKEATIGYEVDGYIHTPALTPYNPRSHLRPLAERVLVALPDICKWKPADQLTIDLALVRSPQGVRLMASKRGDSAGEEFLGTPVHPYARTVDTAHPMVASLPSGTVVEWAWVDNQFVPRRVRTDKPVGNDIQVAKNVWEDIQTPIPFSALAGEGMSHVEFAIDWNLQRVLDPFQTGHARSDVVAVVAPVSEHARLRQLKPAVKKLMVVESDISLPSEQPTRWVYIDRVPTVLPKTTVPVLFIQRGEKQQKLPWPVLDTWTLAYEQMMSVEEKKVAAHVRFSLVLDGYTLPSDVIPVPSPPLLLSSVRGEARKHAYPPRRAWLRRLPGGLMYEGYGPYTDPAEGSVQLTYTQSCWEVEGKPARLPWDARPSPAPHAPTAVVLPETPVAAPARPPLEPLSMISAGSVEVLTVPWSTATVVRVGAIGDGNCFFHAVLQGYHPEYQAKSSVSFRAPYARKMRTAVADVIGLRDPDAPVPVSFYADAGGGALAQLGSVDTDYTLESIQALLRGNAYLGDEVYALVAHVLGVDIYVVRATATTLLPSLSVIYPHRPQWAVVINGTKVHYETVGVRTPAGIQTAFLPDDPFLVELRGQVVN